MAVTNDLNLTDLATLKESLSIAVDDTGKDAYLASLINRASSVFLTLIDVKYFISQSVVETLRGNGSNRLRLSARPVTAVSSLMGESGVGYSAAFNSYSSGYRFDSNGLLFIGDYFSEFEAYTVSYTGGYLTSSVEALAAEQAVLSICNLWFKRSYHQDVTQQDQGNQVTVSYEMSDIPNEAKLIVQKLLRVA